MLEGDMRPAIAVTNPNIARYNMHCTMEGEVATWKKTLHGYGKQLLHCTCANKLSL